METNGIKALPSLYHGILFRSRIEARWAIFFDALDLAWCYEMQGFVLDPVPHYETSFTASPNQEPVAYVPDFWLPNLKTWIEAKPPLADGEWPGDDRQQRLEYATGHHVVTLYGPPGYPPDADGGGNWPYNGFVVGDSEYRWCICATCRVVGIQFEGRAARLAHRSGCKIAASGSDRDHNTHDPMLLAAYGAAAGYRFA